MAIRSSPRFPPPHIASVRTRDSNNVAEIKAQLTPPKQLIISNQNICNFTNIINKPYYLHICLLSQVHYNITVQNRGLKHHSFITYLSSLNYILLTARVWFTRTVIVNRSLERFVLLYITLQLNFWWQNKSTQMHSGARGWVVKALYTGSRGLWFDSRSSGDV